jgi:hypothetical protein
MNKIYISIGSFFVLVFSISFFTISCDKSSSSTPFAAPPASPTSTVVTSPPVYLVSKDSTYDATPANTTVRLFEYDSNKKIVRVNYKMAGSNTIGQFDTIIYNVAGQISGVYKYNVGSTILQASNVMTYSSGLLTSVAEMGNNGSPFVRTRTFIYSGNLPTSQTVVYTSGAGILTTIPDSLTNIIFTGNNISSLVAGSLPITLTFDTTAYQSHITTLFNETSFIDLFNKNNLSSISLTSTPGFNVLNYTYSYLNGRVSQIISSGFNSTGSTIDITYALY